MREAFWSLSCGRSVILLLMVVKKKRKSASEYRMTSCYRNTARRLVEDSILFTLFWVAENLFYLK